MELEQIKRVENMTQEEFEAKKFSVNSKVLNKYFDIEKENVEFDQELYEQNLKELQETGYNFESEYEEGKENANN